MRFYNLVRKILKLFIIKTNLKFSTFYSVYADTIDSAVSNNYTSNAYVTEKLWWIAVVITFYFKAFENQILTETAKITKFYALFFKKLGKKPISGPIECSEI